MKKVKHVKFLKCHKCKKEYKLGEREYNCECGFNLEVIYDYKKIKLTKKELAKNKDTSIWRYFKLMPLAEKKYIPPVQVGWTPLYKAERLGDGIGVKNLYIKDDGRNPSASFKDRASAVAYCRAKEAGAEIITGASTGNAASALSCITGSVCFPTVIFVPKTAPKAKLTQLLTFGAKVIAVNGSYDMAFDLCLEVSAKYGWYNRNTGYNPFTREGKKTCAFEICEQMGWKVPDKVFVSVGDGNIISGIWKGFKDLKEIGFIKKLPQMIAVQSEKSSAIYDAWKEKREIKTVSATTVADSISVDFPRDGDFALAAIKESKGCAVSVKDDHILQSIKILARGAGVFAEPAGATAYAGVETLKKDGGIKANDVCVCVITGNGLKDVDSAMKVAGEPILINPDLASFDKVVKTLGV